MKKVILGIGIALSLGIPAVTSAASNSPLSPAYKAQYCYPTGTYWQKQVSTYPAYYTTNNAIFETKYGSTTRYCL